MEKHRGFIRFEDDKEFEVRGNVIDVYRGFYNPALAATISKIQICLGGLIIAIQVGKLGMLDWEDFTFMEGLYLGIWIPILSLMAAFVSLGAAKNPSYAKLHWGMGLHIIATIFNILLVVEALTDSIPRHRYRVDKLDRDIQSGFFWTPSEMLPMDPSHAQAFQYKVGVNNFCIGMTSLLTLFGMVQVITSTLMGFLCARAICSARNYIDKKCFEKKGVVKEHGKIEYKCEDTPEKMSNTEPPHFESIDLSN